MNPYLPTYEYVPDGEPHVFGDRLYIFGSHDRFGGKGFCENDYVCWSCPTDNLADWKFEGVIYRKDQDPKNRFLKSTMYAPDVCKGTDGRYYLYYGLNSLPLTGVAVCDTPAGKYEFYGYVRHQNGRMYGREKGDVFPFDPAVLNDNGNIFLYSGFSPAQKGLRFAIDLISRKKGAFGNQVLRLADDMLTITERKDLIPGTANSNGTGFEGHEFYEASSIRKFEGIYYFVYSSVLSHELCLAESRFPDKGFRYKGILHSNCDLGFRGNTKPLAYWGNNHGGIERIGESWYIFGHRHTNCRECNRQGVAEKLKSDAGGSFLQAEMTCMGPAGEYLSSGKYQAGICCNLFSAEGAVKSTFFRNRNILGKHPYITQDGEDRECNPALYIRNMKNGSIAGYKYFSCTPSEISLTARGNGIIDVSTDIGFENCCASVMISSREWSVYRTRLSVENNIFPLYFRYRGKESADILDFLIK